MLMRLRRKLGCILVNILVVEDELLLAMATQTILEDAGFTVLKPARSVAEAIPHIGIADAGVLDINLIGETSAAVALALTACGIPFVVLSSLLPGQTDSSWKEASAWLSKPVSAAKLLAAIKRM